jgi:hypothetical protein
VGLAPDNGFIYRLGFQGSDNNRSEIMEKTVSVKGYEFKVDFDHNPAEDRTWDYQGHSESVEINEVWDSDGDLVKDWARELLDEDIEIECLEAVRADEEEKKMAKEESRMDAWEARQEMNLLNL